MPTWVIAVIIVLNIPLYYGLYRLIFQDFDEFSTALWFWLKPDTWSFFDGTFFEDFWAEFKLAIFFGVSFLAVYIEWSLLNSALAQGS